MFSILLETVWDSPILHLLRPITHRDCRGEARLGAVGPSRVHQQERGNIDVGRNTPCDIVRNGRVDV